MTEVVQGRKPQRNSLWRFLVKNLCTTAMVNVKHRIYASWMKYNQNRERLFNRHVSLIAIESLPLNHFCCRSVWCSKSTFQIGHHEEENQSIPSESSELLQSAGGMGKISDVKSWF